MRKMATMLLFYTSDRYKILKFLLLFFLAFFHLAFADSAPIRASTSEKGREANFKFSGYFDGSYNYLVNSNKLTSGNLDRVFDIVPNGTTIQQAGITLAYQPTLGFGGIITPVIGRDPFVFAPYGWNPDFSGKGLGFAIPQGYLQYAKGPWTFMGGSFIELAGAENLFSYNDTNFSRGILWGYAEPFTVLGVRISYIPNNKLRLIGGVNNGWDSIRDTSQQKTIELGASYIFNPIFSLASYLYTGQQRVTDRTSTGPSGQRTLLDIIATINVTKKLTFILNYDGAIQSKAALPNEKPAQASWQGLAAYLNYQIRDKWRTSLRGEVFSDENGYRTGVAQTWKEFTLTLGYTPIKNLEFRAETRHDFSNVNSFVTKNDIGTTNYQQSYAVEAVFQF